MRRTSTLKSDDSKLRKLNRALLAWFSQNARALPWRRTRDPYAIWISEIMLQQTQVKTVVPYWARWMRQLPNLQALARARPEKIHKLWEGLGYYTRVRNLQRAARQILEEHAGRFPENFDNVLALPGVGRYTAGAICSIAFNQPTPILDGNVIRVLTRVFGIASNPRASRTNARLWNLATNLVEAAFKQQSSAPVRSRAKVVPLPGQRAPAGRTTQNACSRLNQSLMELGALVCTPKQPKCGACPLAGDCLAFRHARVRQLPNLASRAASVQRHLAAFVVERQGRFLVRQRPAGVVNAHLWEFPNIQIGGKRTSLGSAARQVLGVAPAKVELLCVVRHSITRFRIILEVHRARLQRKPLQSAGVWLTRAQLRPLAFAAAHMKILALLDKPGRPVA